MSGISPTLYISIYIYIHSNIINYLHSKVCFELCKYISMFKVEHIPYYKSWGSKNYILYRIRSNSTMINHSLIFNIVHKLPRSYFELMKDTVTSQLLLKRELCSVSGFCLNGLPSTQLFMRIRLNVPMYFPIIYYCIIFVYLIMRCTLTEMFDVFMFYFAQCIVS